MAKKSVSANQLNELIECFKSIRDPRVKGRSKHLLIDIIVISVCAVLCGAEGIYEIAQYGSSKEIWFKKYLKLPNGIPSHDTFARVLSLLDSAEIEKVFAEWTREVLNAGESTRTISLDGKFCAGTERSFNRGKKPLGTVSAYSHELGLSLVEAEAIDGSEIDGAMACLEILDVKDLLVTVDAGIGIKKVVQKINDKGGDYLVPLKANQWFYRDEVAEALESRKNKVQTFETEESAHGRDERRTCRVLMAKDMSDRFNTQWPDVKVIFSITRERIEDDKRYFIQETGKDGKQSYRKNVDDLKYAVETVHYVSSRKLTAKEALFETRKHWGIENKLHWVLDVAFREDNWTVRTKSLARSLSLLRKIALNLIRKSKTKGSVRVRMKKAAWSDDFLEELLFF